MLELPVFMASPAFAPNKVLLGPVVRLSPALYPTAVFPVVVADVKF